MNKETRRDVTLIPAWRLNMELGIKKTCIAFYTSKRSKECKEKMFTTVIRPILIYGSIM